MPDRPTCPHCGAAAETDAKPGTLLLCRSCREAFEVGVPRYEVVPDPAPPPPAARAEAAAGFLPLALLVGVGMFAAGAAAGGAAVWFLLPREKPAEVVKAPDPAPPANPAPPAPPPPPAPTPPPKPEPVPPYPPLGQAGRDVPNPFKPGTQVRLRELRSAPLPRTWVHVAPEWPFDRDDPVLRFAYSARHDLLFLVRRGRGGVWAYDLKAGKELPHQRPNTLFGDLCLSPDESALFVSDYGEKTGSAGKPDPSYVHRYDLAARAWEVRQSPGVAWRVEAVDATRFLLLERNNWVTISHNLWEPDGGGIRELSRVATGGSSGDFEFDPVRRRVYHGNQPPNGGVSVRFLDEDTLLVGGNNPVAIEKGSGSVVLSADGTRFYTGRAQIDALNVRRHLRVFPEVIVAASRDVAFGSTAYYRASTGEKLGGYPFEARPGDDPNGPLTERYPAIHVAPGGHSIWLHNPAAATVVQFALEGERDDRPVAARP